MYTCISILLNLVLLAAVFWLIVAVLFRKEILAIFERDPAANGFLEVLLTYSGIHALVFHSIARTLYRMRIPFLPRWISQTGRFFTGIEIHPGATIGKGLFIDHGMGVVIGETAVIGDNVTLYQGVTLGGTGKEKGKRHPTIGNNVVIGAGAKVLGDIKIGDNSYIGSNAVVIKDTPDNSTVVGVPGRVTKQDGKKIELSLDHVHVLDPLLQEIDDLKKRLDSLEK
ncbi:MAG: serine O-acetyltransferase EpsC [Candidatus Omnitrophota bacterium]|jgi:serine O-acetyltransferase|nr:serine O-acetyltransferase [Candidatus Omnitrophota bacterium]